MKSFLSFVYKFLLAVVGLFLVADVFSIKVALGVILILYGLNQCFLTKD